jgi:hypothetical protein
VSSSRIARLSQVAAAVVASSLVAASAAAPARLPPSGSAAGLSGKAARIYDLYYEHCMHYTYRALAWPRQAGSQTQAARMFAGPPRTFQAPAFRGCLAGLGAGKATITVAKLVALAAADEDH